MPWIAAETEHGFELGLKWIESKEDTIAAAGWATLYNFASVHPDQDLNINSYNQLLDRAGKEIHDAQNRVRYTMNGFVIAVGSYVKDLTDKAIKVAAGIGKVNVKMGGTACKVPLASDYIQKIIDRDRIGIKRTAARC